MPNFYKGPIVIDTAAADVLFSTWIHFSSMVWSGYSDATHTCIVQDAAGTVIATFNGDTDLSPQELGSGGGRILGLIVPTLGSGKLTIFLK